MILPTSANYKLLPNYNRKGLDISPTHPTRPVPGSYFPAEVLPISAEEDAIVISYRFLHDRVQQAAYSLVPPEGRPALHKLIGERLLAKVPEEDLDAVLYEIVNQLNYWLEPLSRDERKRLMDLNLRAGKKAIAATAFGAALQYFQVAKTLLDAMDPVELEEEKSKRPTSDSVDDCKTYLYYRSKDRYLKPINEILRIKPIDPIALEINLALIEGHFAQSEYDQSIKIIEEILPRCTKPAYKVRCLMQKMNCLLAQGKLHETIVTGLLGLSALGWEIPTDDDEARIHAAIMRPRILLDLPQIKAIAQMHPLEEENLILLQDVISILLLPVYMARPMLLPSVAFTSVAISLEYGVSTAGAYAMLMSGVILGAEGTQENLLRSYAFGKLAISLIERETPPPPIAPAIYEVYAGHIGVFHQSMAEVLKYLQQAVSIGQAVFNVDYTCFALWVTTCRNWFLTDIYILTQWWCPRAEIPFFSMFGGEPLGAIHGKMLLNKPSIRKYKQSSGQWWMDMPLQFVLNLRGQGNADPLNFAGELLGSNVDIDRMISGESMSHAYLFSMLRLIVATLFNKYEVAAELATNYCEPLSYAMVGTFYCALTEFYSAVAFLEIGMENLTAQQRLMLDRNITDVKEWSANAKGTFLHKSVFLEAESLRIAGDDHFKTLDKYEEAIALANKVSYWHDAAFINERCALWLRRLSKKRSLPFLREAYRLYATWNANAKLKDLKRQYPDDLFVRIGVVPIGGREKIA